MPYHIGSHAQCPASKPHAVLKSNDGRLMGCHMSEAEAKAQMAALYAKDKNRSGSMNDLERRFTTGAVELRSSNEKRSIDGYAAVFGKLSRNLGGFVEKLAPTVFNESRGREWPDVVARHNHDDMMLLGTTNAGTLKLQIDETGLRYTVEPPQSRSDILELVQRGDIRHSSFAFRTVADEWGVTDQNYPMRTLHNVQLVDVATVVSPAYPDATAGLRSLAQKFEIDVEEVRSLAAQDELRKFFVRTDKKGRVEKPKPKISGRQALLELKAKEKPPWAA